MEGKIEFAPKKYTLCNIEAFKAKGGNPSKFDTTSTQYFIVEKEGKILGDIAFTKDHFLGWPSHYFILKINSYLENEGIGSSLVAAVESEAKRNKINLVVLRYKRSDLWEKLGYTIDKENNLAWKNIVLS